MQLRSLPQARRSRGSAPTNGQARRSPALIPVPVPGHGQPPLRVLHVDVRLLHGDAGAYVGLVSALGRRPEIRQAMAAARGSPLAVALARVGVPVFLLPWGGGAEALAMQALVRQTQHGWDLVHAHDSQALHMCLVALCLTGSTAALIASRRDAGPVLSPWKWRRADLVLAHSADAWRRLVESGLERRRVHMAPRGADPAASMLHAYRLIAGARSAI